MGSDRAPARSADTGALGRFLDIERMEPQDDLGVKTGVIGPAVAVGLVRGAGGDGLVPTFLSVSLAFHGDERPCLFSVS